MTSKRQPSNKKSNNSASAKKGSGAASLKKLWITTAVTVVVLGGIILLYIFLPAVANKAETSALIKIPKNATYEMLHDSVAKYLGTKYADNLVKMAKVQRHSFETRHGAYSIDSGMSPFMAERLLFKGAQQPLNLTINGSRGLTPLSQRVANVVDIPSDSLKNFMANPEALSDYGLKPSEALALFIDDTYQVYWNITPEQLTKKIGSNYKKIWTPERLKKAHELGLTPAEVITIASIVDEETNKADEKPQVARLYINRLKKDMKLQADPTVKFALGDFSLRRIRGEHLKVESPYNTYYVTGLPPGPIRTVTVKDIDAVLDAPVHDYIYMCAKDDFSGYHSFAKDYNTHMKNARNYQKALNRRGII